MTKNTAPDLGPLDWRLAIVDKAGRPTPEFQRRWATQRGNNDLIRTITTGNGTPVDPPVSNGDEYIDVNADPPTLYVGSNGAWVQVGVSEFTELTDVPNSYTAQGSKLVQVKPDVSGLQFNSLSSVLDSISTTRGTVLYRGASGWSGLGPGTSGFVLTTGGAGVDPTWHVAAAGSVTSVALTAPSIFTVSGSPVTGSGTLLFSLNTQTANKVFASATSGGAAVPAFRALVAADIPSLSYAPVTSGTAILYGDGAGGFSSVTIGTGLTFLAGTLSSTGGGSGTVTTTGSPASGNLAFFSGTTSITSGNLSGDGTTSGTGALTVTKTGGVAFGYFATGTDASNLTGTVASARISGSYTGITGVGTLSVGSIPSTLITGLGYFATGTDAANLTGTVSVNRFNSGTGATSSTFLNGAGNWATPLNTGTPGGSTTQVQYNNAGSFGGISGATTDGTTLTLVAPVLGTPASGTLTNATGLPIIAGTTGTLTVARGGTGVGTLGANGVVIGQGTGNVTVTGTGTSGQVLTSNGSGVDPSFQDGGHVITNSNLDLMLFGDGIDGDLIISSGTTQITRDMWYRNVTLSGTASLQNSNGAGTRAFQIHISGTLDLTNAPAGAIKSFVSNGGAGGTTGSGGTNSSGTNGGTLGGGNSGGGNGSNGGVAAGTVGTAGAAVTAFGGPGGASGASGLGSGGVGKPAVAVGTFTTPLSDVRILQSSTATFATGTYTFQIVGQGGSSGASGGGDGTRNGGAGGAGGAGSSGLDIFARTIARGGSTAAGAISANAGAGGAGGFTTLGTNCGGGAGGGGGGGGWIRLIFRTLTGSTATNMVSATGGSGGAGGNASGTGVGGDSGTPGGGGRIDVYNLGAGTQSMTATTAVGTPNAHSGTTGGGTASAVAQQISI